MTEWIEVPKKTSGAGYDVPADKVAFSLRTMPKRHAECARIYIGHAAARRLGWTGETRVRLFWSGGGDKVKMEPAPPRRAQCLSPARHQERLDLLDLDDGAPGESDRRDRAARGRRPRGDRRRQPPARGLSHRHAVKAGRRRCPGAGAREGLTP